MTADEYLRQDTGAIISSLLFQLAMVKAELDRVRAERNGQPVPDLVPRGAP